MPQRHSMTDRMLGAARLDMDIFEEVETDTTATGQAAGVVSMVTVARAIGAAGLGLGAMIGGMVAAFLGWLIWAGVTCVIGDKLLGGTGKAILTAVPGWLAIAVPMGLLGAAGF